MFSPVLYLLSLCHWPRPLLNCPSLICLPCQHPLIIPTHLCQPALAPLPPVQIYEIQLHNRTITLSIAPLRSMTTMTLILILDTLNWIPAAKIAMRVISWRIHHWQCCRIFNTLPSPTWSNWTPPEFSGFDWTPVDSSGV